MRTIESLVALIAITWFQSLASGGMVITGVHTLQPNQANQVINILANPTVAGEIAQGFNLNFVVDDGGSIAGGIDNNAPKITGINLKPAGGLFSAIPDAQNNVLSTQKLFQVTIAPANVANRPVITNNVLLAQVTLDTTGLFSGAWVLDLDGLPGVGLPSSDFAGAATVILNGTVAVPEPSSLLCVGALTGLAAVRRWRKQIG